MKSNSFKPNWASPPGDTILDLLRDRLISIAEFSDGINESGVAVDAILKGHTEITAKHAKKLESFFGISAVFWLSRESQYRQDLIRNKQQEEASQIKQWLTELPIRDMVKFGWIKGDGQTKPSASECLNFFGVDSFVKWREKIQIQQQLAYFRTSNSFEQKPLAVATWLRRGEIEGENSICAEWSLKGFQDSLKYIRNLSRTKSPSEFLPKLEEICAQSGVALVIVRSPNGCRASGAARFLDENKALIMLSFRHLTDDHFWFSFFHEAGHLILHSSTSVFIDGLDLESSLEEDQANAFAAECLIPEEYRSQLFEIELNPSGILRFAKKVGISPGIIIGQLQNSGRVRRDRLNAFKQRYTWDEIDAYLSSR